MKFLKRVSLILTCALLVFSCACTGQTKTYKLFGGSYWLADSTAGGVSPIYEKCSYQAEVIGSTDTRLNLKLTESNFTTVLESTTYEGINCYKFSTDLVIKGSYENAEKSIEISDLQHSECYFLGLSDKLTPIYSEKTVSSITPTETQEGIAFPRIEYTAKCNYNRETGIATAVVTVGENCTKGYEFLASENTYEKYNSNNFIDNNCMFFLPRACQLEEGFTQSFYTLDVLGQKILPMRIGVNAQQPTAEISIAKYFVDGKPLASENNLKKFTVYNLSIQINSNFSGKALEFCYTTTAEDNRNRLISFKQQLPLSLGNLKFTLYAINTNA